MMRYTVRHFDRQVESRVTSKITVSMQSICVADYCKLLLKILTAVWHRYFQKIYFLLCSWGIYHFHWLICSSNIRYVSIIYSNISLYLSRICFTIINNSNSKQHICNKKHHWFYIWIFKDYYICTFCILLYYAKFFLST